MKAIITSTITGLLLFSMAKAQQRPFSQAAQAVGYAIVTNGPHHRVWAKVESITNSVGQVFVKTNSFHELQTGLNRWNGQKWVEANPELFITNNVIVGRGGAHSAIFADNVNSVTAVQVKQSNGQWLRGGPLCLAYHDSSNGSNIYFATVKDSTALLVGSNRVVYPDAFDGVTASVSYSYTRAGVSQDIRFQSRPPLPSAFGLNPQTTHLLVITEFTNTVQPQVEEHTWQAGFETIHDKTLHFGAMSMFPGRAFKASTPRKRGIRVAKDWITTPEARTMLIESICFTAARSELSTLPSTTTNTLAGATNAAITRPSRWVAQHTLPARPQATTSLRNGPEYVTTWPDSEAFVMDWDVESDDGFWAFTSGTWFIPGPCRISDAEFYAGAVLKYMPGCNSSLEITGTANSMHDFYTILTSACDPLNGDILDFECEPQEGDYGPAIVLDDCSQQDNLWNLEIFYATEGVVCSTPTKPTVTVTADRPVATKGANPLESGSFTITRADGDWTQPLIVQFSLDGSVANSPDDYGNIGTSVQIDAFTQSQTVTIVPGSPGGSLYQKYVSLTLLYDPAYNVGDSSSAKVFIYDPLAVAPPYSAVNAPAGLVSMWKGESTAIDVETGISGTFYNAPTPAYRSGEVGKAFVFTGAGGHVRIPDQPAFHVTDACTIEAWVNPASTGNWHEIVSKWDAYPGASGKSYTMGTYPDGRVYLTGSHDGNDSSAGTVSSLNPLYLGQWTHVAATYDGTNLRMYINGALQNTVSWPGSFYQGTHDLSIGACVGNAPPGAGISYYDGRIDEVSLYNTALSESQILSVVIAGRGGKLIGIPDWWAIEYFGHTGIDPSDDPDHDGLTNLQEFQLGSDPIHARPEIIVQPQNQTVDSGQAISLSVSASGESPILYQWKKNGVPLVDSSSVSGATTAALTISPAAISDSGYYTVDVSNAGGMRFSAAATVSVCALGAPTPGSAGGGGDIYVRNGHLSMVHCRSTSAIAGYPVTAADAGPAYFTGDGGSILVHGDTGNDLSITNSRFMYPTCYGNGGAIYVANDASTNGRKWFVMAAAPAWPPADPQPQELGGQCSGSISNCSFELCSGGWQGGAVGLCGRSIWMNILHSRFGGCRAGDVQLRDGKGGALAVCGGLQSSDYPTDNVDVNGCLMAQCTASGNGGGVYATIRGLLQLDNTTISQCAALNGAGGETFAKTEGMGGGAHASAGGELRLNNGTVLTLNTAAINGGGLSVKSATAKTEDGVSISQNMVSYAGSTGYGNGGGTFVTTSFYDDGPPLGPGYWGAIIFKSDGSLISKNGGSFSIQNNPAPNNVVSRYGGGLYVGIVPPLWDPWWHAGNYMPANISLDSCSIGDNRAQAGVVVSASPPTILINTQMALERVRNDNADERWVWGFSGTAVVNLINMAVGGAGNNATTDLGIYSKDSLNPLMSPGSLNVSFSQVYPIYP